MRAVLLAACLLLCASAASAEPPQCRRLTKQQAHYQTLLDRAHSADNALWESRLDTQIGYLRAQRRQLGCPDAQAAFEAMMAEMKELMKLAAEGALTFFTGGAM
jgi:hypothetical protein